MFCTNNRPPALGHLRRIFFFNIWRLDLDTRVGHSESELLSTKSKIDQLESDNTGDQVTEYLYFAIYVRSTFQRLKNRFGLSKKIKKQKKMFSFNKHFLRNKMIYCVWLFTNMVLQCLLCFNLHVQVWRPELESVKVNCSTPSLGLTNCRKTTQVTSSSYSGVSAGSKP